MAMSETEYEDYFARKEAEWESLCKRCGGCCGAYDDPCKHLRKSSCGTYYCAIYEKRFGERQALSGEKFDCVPVKDILHTHWKNDHLCAYKQRLRSPGNGFISGYNAK
jgi:uncharacterized cysteine cluster protein YcgN (CxxCxxCC family)